MTEATATDTASTSPANAAVNSEATNSGSAVETGNNGSSSTRTAIDMMRGVLGKSIKCTLDDGRIATGTFVCMDRL